jgi:hypothetical protein
MWSRLERMLSMKRSTCFSASGGGRPHPLGHALELVLERPHGGGRDHARVLLNQVPHSLHDGAGLPFLAMIREFTEVLGESLESRLDFRRGGQVRPGRLRNDWRGFALGHGGGRVAALVFEGELGATLGKFAAEPAFQLRIGSNIRVREGPAADEIE